MFPIIAKILIRINTWLCFAYLCLQLITSTWTSMPSHIMHSKSVHFLIVWLCAVVYIIVYLQR